MKDEGITIFVDVQEKKSGIIELLEKRGVDVVVKKLEVADYILSERVGVERKTVSDFVHSIKGKRLFKQILYLKENFECPLFMIEEGFKLIEPHGIHPKGLKGALSFIQVLNRIPLIYTKDVHDTAEFLYIIARQEKLLINQKVSLKAKKIGDTLAEQQRYVIESIPNIGPKLSDSILKHFGTIKRFILADEEELIKVPKIGEKKAKRIKEILVTPYKGEELSF
jgi:Fanconi anemia group M protein